MMNDEQWLSKVKKRKRKKTFYLEMFINTVAMSILPNTSYWIVSASAIKRIYIL